MYVSFDRFNVVVIHTGDSLVRLAVFCRPRGLRCLDAPQNLVITVTPSVALVGRSCNDLSKFKYFKAFNIDQVFRKIAAEDD